MTSFSPMRGHILLLSVIYLGVFLTVSSALLGQLTSFTKSERHTIEETQARLLAEAALEKTVYELNQNSSYAGETNTAISGGTFSTSVASVDSSTKRVTAT